MENNPLGEIEFHNDRASRMDLKDDAFRVNPLPGYSEDERIAMQMSGVSVRLHEEDPDEMSEVQEQLRMDVREESSEDDYEDESESEELLRRMPWLKYTAPEVLERASNRSYQYKGVKQRAQNRAEEGRTNPYEGEAFKEAVDELREKIIEAKENADEATGKRPVRDKVYIPPMHEPVRPKEGPVPFTASALFREPEPDAEEAADTELLNEELNVDFTGGDAKVIDEPEPIQMPAPDDTFNAVREEVRSFKEGIIDLDDDVKERAVEAAEEARFEREEALAEAVMAEEGAEKAFDASDDVRQFAPVEETPKARGIKPLPKPLTAMERLKAMARTDELDEAELIRTGKKKMTALDRLEQMQTLERQGIPYAAQHRMGVGSPQVPPMMGQPYPYGVQQPMAQPVSYQSNPMMPQMGQPAPYGQPQMAQPMQQMMAGPVPMPPYAPQPMPQMAQPMQQQMQQPAQPEQRRGFDFTFDNNANFDF